MRMSALPHQHFLFFLFSPIFFAWNIRRRKRKEWKTREKSFLLQWYAFDDESVSHHDHQHQKRFRLDGRRSICLGGPSSYPTHHPIAKSFHLFSWHTTLQLYIWAYMHLVCIVDVLLIHIDCASRVSFFYPLLPRIGSFLGWTTRTKTIEDRPKTLDNTTPKPKRKGEPRLSSGAVLHHHKR